MRFIKLHLRTNDIQSMIIYLDPEKILGFNNTLQGTAVHIGMNQGGMTGILVRESVDEVERILTGGTLQ